MFQNKSLSDIKVLLRDSATREKSLMNEKDELLRKISILERFPPGAKLTDSEVKTDSTRLVLGLVEMLSHPHATFYVVTYCRFQQE